MATDRYERRQKEKESFYIPGYLQELIIKIWLLGILKIKKNPLETGELVLFFGKKIKFHENSIVFIS